MCMEIKRFSQGHLLGPWQEEGAEVTKCRNLPWDGYYSRGMQSSLLSLSMNWPQLCAPLTCAQTVPAPVGTALLDTRVRGKACRHRAGGEGREVRRTQLEGSRHLTDRFLGWQMWKKSIKDQSTGLVTTKWKLKDKRYRELLKTWLQAALVCRGTQQQGVWRHRNSQYLEKCRKK